MKEQAIQQASTADWVAAIGQVAGALFTFVAVVVALWIAISDSRRRDRDEETRAKANARMVLVRGTGSRVVSHDDHGYQLDLMIYFTNHGDRPIFDVYAEAWPEGTALDEPPQWAVAGEIVQPGEPEECFMMKVTSPSELIQLAAWRVRWTDADGRHWFGDQTRQYQPLPYTGQAPRRYTGQPDRDRHDLK